MSVLSRANRDSLLTGEKWIPYIVCEVVVTLSSINSQCSSLARPVCPATALRPVVRVSRLAKQEWIKRYSGMPDGGKEGGEP